MNKTGTDPSTIEWTSLNPAVSELLATMRQETALVYVVGGTVRDLLLGRQPLSSDLDIVVDGPALTLARRVADRLGWAYYALDSARDTARLVFQAAPGSPLVCDIAGLRGGQIEVDLFARDFTVNAMALALHVDGPDKLIDVTGGREDLENHLLRRVTTSSLAEDAVRLLRAARLVVQFDFTLEEETRTQIHRLARTISLCSPERVRDELWKMFATRRPAQAIRELVSLGLLGHVLPEMTDTVGVEQSFPHDETVFEHTLSTISEARFLRDWTLGRDVGVDSAGQQDLLRLLEPWRFNLRRIFSEELAVGHTRAEWLVWFALLHDVGKPSVRTAEPISAASHATPLNSIQESAGGTPNRYRFLLHESVGAELAEVRLTSLRFSRHEVGLAHSVVANHMRPHFLHSSFEGKPISRRACHRFFRDIGGGRYHSLAGLDALLLALADHQATYADSPPPDWNAYLEHAAQLLTFIFETHASTGQKLEPLVDGHKLMRNLNLQPGPLIGQALEYLLEAQIAGEVTSTEEALQLASEWLDQQGL